MTLKLSGGLGVARPDLTEAYQALSVPGILFAWDKILPIANVEEQSAIIPAMDLASMTTIESMDRQPSGHYNRINIRVGELQWTCRDVGLEYPMVIGDGRLAAQLPTAAQEQMALATLKLKHWLRLESFVANAVFSLGGSIPATAAWSIPATANPVADILNAQTRVLERTGVKPNTLFLSAGNYAAMLGAASLRGLLPGVAMISPEQINQVLSAYGITTIAVSTAIANIAAEGLPINVAPVVGDNMVAVAYCAAADSPYTQPSLGRTFNWIGDSPSPAGEVEMYPDQTSRSVVLRVRQNIDQKIWVPELCQLVDVSG